VKPADLTALLEELYRDKFAQRQRHVAAARLVGHYDFNNTYQYVIAREDTHLAWLRDALAPMGGALAQVPEPEVASGRRGPERLQTILRDDADATRAFVEKWRDRVASISHARHRRMCEVVVGETREHQRFFEQALAGRDDLLGRRHATIGTGGGVLPVRWVE
jgi:hypothetical protein